MKIPDDARAVSTQRQFGGGKKLAILSIFATRTLPAFDGADVATLPTYGDGRATGLSACVELTWRTGEDFTWSLQAR